MAGDREALLRALRKEARKRGLTFTVDKKKGKGSHYLVTVGDRRATVPRKVKHLEKIIRRQLGLD